MSEREERRTFTKIVATLGPASEDRIGELLDAGLDVARLNFSHGDAEDHRRRANAVRAAAAERGREIGILADIQGPKIRLGRFPEAWRRVRRGDTLVLREGDGVADEGEIYVDFEGFARHVQVGQRIFLADGVVEVSIEERRDSSTLVGEVRRGGMLGDRKGVNLPDTDLSVDLPTAKDRIDIDIARDLGVDFIGVSFVDGPKDVLRVRELAPDTGIVSKIERAAAIERIEDILAVSDGIMVARGDLGVEVALDRLPIHQKNLIQAARDAGKFAITATEMLESMVHVPRPTRAEAADVANAVLDGSDALMLSAETAVGEYPVEAVATMDRIARTVESSRRYRAMARPQFDSIEIDFGNAMAQAAVDAADALELDTIVCFTESGNTPRLLARYRPNAMILALSPNPETLRRVSVLSHVRAIPFPREKSLEDMLWAASRLLLDMKLATFGDPVVFVAGVPPGVSRTTNVIKLHRIGEPVRLH